MRLFGKRGDRALKGKGACYMASSRTRITTTIRSDNPVPRRRSKKKESGVGLAVILLGGLILFAMTRTNNRPHGPQPQRVVAPR